jgi:uncharacterized protein (TIGR02217 family)
MSFREVQLPKQFALDARGGAGFSTSVVEAQSGFEQRNVNWSQTRARFDIGFINKGAAYKSSLISFFRAVAQGKAYGFRLRDWSDYSVTGQAVGTGNGSTQNIQLVKTYSAGGYTYSRTITKPVTEDVKDADGNNVTNTFKLYYNGVLQDHSASPSVYTLDHTTGILTCHPSNGVAITADFQFDIPVRFDIDDMAGLTIHTPPEGGTPVYSWPSVPLVELRV